MLGAYCSNFDDRKPYLPAIWPNSYNGRGAMNLKYSTKYGRFSKAFYPEDFEGEKLRNNPDIVSEKGNQAFASALWQFMTPTDPAPSIHDIVFGRWEPNDSDLEQGLERSFGLTTKILYGDEECGTARA